MKAPDAGLRLYYYLLLPHVYQLDLIRDCLKKLSQKERQFSVNALLSCLQVLPAWMVYWKLVSSQTVVLTNESRLVTSCIQKIKSWLTLPRISVHQCNMYIDDLESGRRSGIKFMPNSMGLSLEGNTDPSPYLHWYTKMRWSINHMNSASVVTLFHYKAIHISLNYIGQHCFAAFDI